MTISLPVWQLYGIEDDKQICQQYAAIRSQSRKKLRLFILLLSELWWYQASLGTLNQYKFCQ